jgi:SAM-dependent methyltransferase
MSVSRIAGSGEARMPSPMKDPGQLVVDLAFGFVLSGALATAVKLGIPDLLASRPMTANELAENLHADAQSVHRLMRSLSSFDVFREDGQRRFHATPASVLLQRTTSNTLRDAVLMITQDIFWKPIGVFEDVVLTGRNGMERIFGKPFFDYLSDNRRAGEIFHAGMSSLSDMENRNLAQSYDFTPFGMIVDVGGGHGGFLIEILKTAPRARGIDYDRAHVLKDARVDELPGRWACVQGDFLESVPAGADAYVLKRIIHDWTDETCIRILRNIRQAMAPGGRVLVADTVVPPGNEPHGGKVLDMLMMASLEGRERTEAEFADLFDQSGLRLSRIYNTPALLSLTEAVAV